MKKWMAVVLACMLLVLVTGCKEQAKTSLTEPSRSSDPILSLPTQPSVGRNDPTPVYVSVFGDTMVLATYPVETWGVDQYGLPLKPECPVLACAAGGRLSCGESHELKTPITKVIILERIAPASTEEWFMGMGSLSQIQGIEKLDMQFVKNMNNMFEGCGSLRELPEWYIEA